MENRLKRSRKSRWETTAAKERPWQTDPMRGRKKLRSGYIGTFRIAVKRKSPALAKGSLKGGEGHRERESFTLKIWEKAKGIKRVKDSWGNFLLKERRICRKIAMWSIDSLFSHSILEAWCFPLPATDEHPTHVAVLWAGTDGQVSRQPLRGSPAGNSHTRVWPRKGREDESFLTI